MTNESPAGSRRITVGVAVPAAGQGRRMGGAQKPFLELDGQPVLLHALRPFLADERVVRVSVALSSEVVADPPGWLATLDPRVVLVAGGETRGDSVAAAIEALGEDVDLIAVHDAARPLVRGETVDRCVAIAARGVGAVAGAPAIDTMKRVDSDARVVGTPDRSELWAAHTPQVFPAEMLRKAYERGGVATDDSALVESVGGTVEMVDDGGWNLKVTRPADVDVAEAILAARRAK